MSVVVASAGAWGVCPIGLAEFEEPVADPTAARFFPPGAYTAKDFCRFELGTDHGGLQPLAGRPLPAGRRARPLDERRGPDGAAEVIG